MKKTTLSSLLAVIMLITALNYSFAQDKPTVPAKKANSATTQKTVPGGPRGGGGQGGSSQDTTVVHPPKPPVRSRHHLDSLQQIKMKD